MVHGFFAHFHAQFKWHVKKNKRTMKKGSVRMDKEFISMYILDNRCFWGVSGNILDNRCFLGGGGERDNKQFSF